MEIQLIDNRKSESRLSRRKLGWFLAAARAVYNFISKLIFRPGNLRLRQIKRGKLKYLVWQNEDIGRKMILLREFEKSETEFFCNLVQDGDVCLDVGGNIGYFALNFGASCGPTGVVHVFEPILRNSLVIELAAEINNIRNLKIFRGVATDVAGPVQIKIPRRDSAYAHIAAEDGPSEYKTETVPGVTLDDYLAEQGSPALKAIKIDVEGAELKVLKGVENTLRDPNRRPVVVMSEIVPAYLARFGCTADEVFSFMENCGFSPHRLDRLGRLEAFQKSDLGNIINVFFVGPEVDQ